MLIHDNIIGHTIFAGQKALCEAVLEALRSHLQETEVGVLGIDRINLALTVLHIGWEVHYGMIPSARERDARDHVVYDDGIVFFPGTSPGHDDAGAWGAWHDGSRYGG